jgi:beta-ureidopropionase
MARYVRVTTVAWSAGAAGCPDLEQAHARLRALLDQAGRDHPDLVALTEFCNVHSGTEWFHQAQPIPGPTTDLCAEMARKHGMNVVCSIPEQCPDGMRNTSAFINRQGQVVGKYHKVQPTIGEMEKGIIPGTESPAFSLDIGPVGAAICFDLKFAEVAQMLAASRPRLCVFSSMFIGGARLQEWARNLGCYVLSSVPSHSYIVDMSGRVLAETGSEIDQVRAGLMPPIASTVINMDRCFFHLDYNQDHLQAIVARYGAGVEIEICYPEAHFTLASALPDVTVDEIIAEYGLEPWPDYLDRARGVRTRALAGELPIT